MAAHPAGARARPADTVRLEPAATWWLNGCREGNVCTLRYRNDLSNWTTQVNVEPSGWLVQTWTSGHLDRPEQSVILAGVFPTVSSSEGEGEKESAKYMNILMNKYRCGLQNTIAFRKDIKRGIWKIALLHKVLECFYFFVSFHIKCSFEHKHLL